MMNPSEQARQFRFKIGSPFGPRLETESTLRQCISGGIGLHSLGWFATASSAALSVKGSNKLRYFLLDRVVGLDFVGLGL